MIVSSEPDSGVRMTSVLLLVECGSVLAVMTNVSSIMWHYILVYSANTDTSKPHQTLRPRKVRNAPTLSGLLCVGSHTVACPYPSVKHFYMSDSAGKMSEMSDISALIYRSNWLRTTARNCAATRSQSNRRTYA